MSGVVTKAGFLEIENIEFLGRELENDEAAEREELAAIYVKRGIEPSLAQQVAVQLMAHDALGELGRQPWTP